MKEIIFEDGLIILGGEELPGLLVSLRISGKVLFDEQKVDGSSGKNKTPQGWDDCDIVATVSLLTDEETDCYEKLEVLNGYFRNPDSKANPQIYDISNRHARSRNIRQVIFSTLDSSESNQDDTIVANLAFREHNPPIIRTERAAAKTPTPRELAEKAEQQEGKIGGTVAAPEEDETITGDLA